MRMLKGAFVFGGVYDHRGWSAWLARGSGASEAEVMERRGMSVVRGRGAALDARQADLTARVERLEAMGAVGLRRLDLAVKMERIRPRRCGYCHFLC